MTPPLDPIRLGVESGALFSVLTMRAARRRARRRNANGAPHPKGRPAAPRGGPFGRLCRMRPGIGAAAARPDTTDPPPPPGAMSFWSIGAEPLLDARPTDELTR